MKIKGFLFYNQHIFYIEMYDYINHDYINHVFEMESYEF